ncbi:MAG: protein kinase [Nanoarchaeota archaeon]|nr:protein kinase [Nanoarchaeota archaeon]
MAQNTEIPDDELIVLDEKVLGSLGRQPTVNQVLSRFERGTYAIPISNHSITLTPQQFLGKGGEGITYRSGDDLGAAVKLRPILSGLPPLPQFGEGPVPVACSYHDGALELQRLPSGPRAIIQDLRWEEQGAYRHAAAEQTITHTCSGLPGAVEFLDGTYLLVVEERGSQLLAGLLTKLIDGKTLSDHMKIGDLSLQEKLLIVAQVGDTLREYQRRSIVHGDLKPRNIMIDEGKRPTIIDHGISQLLLNEYKDLGHICGTPMYLAPEAAANRFNRKTDFYSLGIIAYELLMGEHPYPANGINGWNDNLHYFRLQGFFCDTVEAEKFCYRVRKALGERGYAPRLAWSIAGALHGQPASRETSLPDVAREYAALETSKRVQPPYTLNKGNTLWETMPVKMEPDQTTLLELTEAMRLTGPELDVA